MAAIKTYEFFTILQTLFMLKGGFKKLVQF